MTEPAEKKLEQRETALQGLEGHVHVFVCLCVFATGATWSTCSVSEGPTQTTPPCARRGTPRQHLPPSRVGGADRPKGRESRRAGARKSGRPKR